VMVADSVDLVAAVLVAVGPEVIGKKH
jgi:hypothetical protein